MHIEVIMKASNLDPMCVYNEPVVSFLAPSFSTDVFAFIMICKNNGNAICSLPLQLWYLERFESIYCRNS